MSSTKDAGPADTCLVCGSKAQSELYAATFGGTAQDASRYFLTHRSATAHGRIVRCDECGFVFTSPRFSDPDYDRIYKAIEPPASVAPGFDRANAARFSRLARLVRRYPAGRGRLLDFGCGDGSFLRILNDSVARGFEIGSPGSRMAGRSRIDTGDWATVAGSAEMPARSFDCVTAFDVLEHLPRIREDLALVRNLIAPDGLFFASVPNVRSLMARAMGRRWAMFLLEHLWYFSPGTFRQFMADQGFDMLACHGVPYDASMNHLATRLSQLFGIQGTLGLEALADFVLPVPTGLMLGVFRPV